MKFEGFMRKIYIAFLGKGQQNGYSEAVYELNGKKASRTRFVQAAEIELYGINYFDKVIIVATEASKKSSYKGIIDALNTINFDTDIVTPLIISEDMSSEGQWKWFEQILQHIEHGDELTVDLTHGYRSIPIVLSTAIYFLQKARAIRLNAVYYGAYEQNREITPIVDMKDFYLINEWAEGVSRLVEDADARKIAMLSNESKSFKISSLNDPVLINALKELTDFIRNVDVHHIPERAQNTIQLIQSREKEISQTERILLRLIIEKFDSLASPIPVSGYTHKYFAVQLEIIRLLLDHHLYMQAFTVMREFVGSIGLIQERKSIFSSDGKTLRWKAELFIRMMMNEKENWKFSEAEQQTIEKILPLYNQFDANGIAERLRGFANELASYRNGFDHAWTSKNADLQDIGEKGYQYYRKLRLVIDSLIECKMIRD
jgi:hypothetical protein